MGSSGLAVRNFAGTVIMAGGFALTFGGIVVGGSNGRYLIAAGFPFGLVGVLILLPLLSRTAVALLRPLLARVFGSSGNLACRNVVLNPRRTTTMAAALTVGFTLASAVTVLGTSVDDAVDRIGGKGLVADYNVTASTRNGMSPQLAARVAEAPGVLAASPLTRVYWEVDGKVDEISGVNTERMGCFLHLAMESGSANALRHGLILVSSARATAANLAVGNTVRVTYGDGTTEALTVGGVFQPINTLSGMVMSNDAIAEHGRGDVVIREVLVGGGDGATTALRQSIKDVIGENASVQVQGQAEMKEGYGKIHLSPLVMEGSLLIMSAIAALWIAKSLAMSVDERPREIGMLHAIGLDRRGIKQTVTLESVIISMFGATLGVLLGIFLAWAVIDTLGSILPGLTTELPYGQLFFFLLLAGLIGLAAAIWPAHRSQDWTHQ